MNSIAARYAVAILAICLITIALVIVLRNEHLSRVRSAVNWLLKVSFFDLVEMIIFIRPWKAHVEQIALVIWLILAFVVGRYMIVVHPDLTEIPGPYIPFIGYMYFVTTLIIMRTVLRVMKNND